MIWHIFKKDWKLLWVFVITVASLHWIAAFIIFKLGLFGEDAMLEMLSEAVPILAFFASMFLIAAIVHVEAIPGVRQDWRIVF
jgi:membrane-anchored glycerophosphoryl diester phosphodiesterase (GDPDase)